MKQQIVDIVERYPKLYHTIITRKAELRTWVDENCIFPSHDTRAKIYSAVTQVSSVCQYGVDRSLKNWDSGFKFCGQGKKCQCLVESNSKKIKNLAPKTGDERAKISAKRAATNLARHGTVYPVHKNKAKPGDRLHDCAKVLLERDWLLDQYETQKKSMKQIAEELGVDNSTVNWYIEYHGIKKAPRSNKSTAERKVAEYIYYECKDEEIYQSDTTIINPYELDITAPNAKIAIEYNGLYYHSVASDKVGSEVSSLKHRQKSLSCATRGFKLLHLTDYTWKVKTDYPKTWLKRVYDLLPTFERTSMDLREVDFTIANEFYLVNGPYGIDLECDLVMGLYDGDNLIEIFPFITGGEVVVKSPTCKLFCNSLGSIDSVVEYALKISSNHQVTFEEDMSLPIPNGVETQLLYKTSEILDDVIVCDNSKLYNSKVVRDSPEYDENTSFVANAISMGYRVYNGAGLVVWKSNALDED